MCNKRGNVVHRLVRLGYLIRSCITCLLRCLSIPEQKGSIRRRNSPQFSGAPCALTRVLPIELTRATAYWPKASIDAVGLLRDQVLALRL